MIQYLFVAIYLLVDILYVKSSIPIYQNAIKKIQGTNTIQPFGLFAGTLAYLIMGMAWLFFVPSTIRTVQEKYKMHRALAGAIVGFILGLTIYGVFNFTNHAMFDNWGLAIMTRDLLWGISWLTVISSLYAYFSK